MSQAAARQTSNAPEHSTAYYFIEGLNELGIEHLFCNFGTDHAPMIEAMADREKRGEKVPNVMLCPHENTAAHMAMGYAMVTGRGQAVLVHVDVGTANTANAMHNLFRSRLPVLLMSGKAPYTSSNELVGSRDTYVHFVQEPIDQGALVRPYMKWEWTLPSGVVVKEALRRAHTIMENKPAGPVYFMAQRETLTEQWATDQIRSYPAEQFSQPQSGGADPATIAQLADRLIAAEHPILICGYAGRNAKAAKLIEELAKFAGIAVFEGNQTFNISHEFPCFLGYSPNKHLPKRRRRHSGGRRRAVVPGRRVAQGRVVLGPHRRRHAQVRVADVDLPGQHPHAGRLRSHPRATARRTEGEGQRRNSRMRRKSASRL